MKPASERRALEAVAVDTVVVVAAEAVATAVVEEEVDMAAVAVERVGTAAEEAAAAIAIAGKPGGQSHRGFASQRLRCSHD